MRDPITPGDAAIRARVVARLEEMRRAGPSLAPPAGNRGRDLAGMLLFGSVLVRSPRCERYHDAVGTAPGVDTIAKAARLDTVRNLASRGLVAWDGTAHDPDRRAVPSERGRFVVRHGAVGAPTA